MSSCPIHVSFVSFSCLMSLTITSTILNKSEEVESCFVTDFRGRTFSFSSFSVMLDIDLSKAFIMLQYDPFAASFFSVGHERMLNFVQRPSPHLLRLL